MKRLIDISNKDASKIIGGGGWYFDITIVNGEVKITLKIRETFPTTRRI